eukprot:229030-Pleurochrysis_carterae.AAC.4
MRYPKRKSNRSILVKGGLQWHNSGVSLPSGVARHGGDDLSMSMCCPDQSTPLQQSQGLSSTS